MMKKIKSKLTSHKSPESSKAIENPTLPPPSYVYDNPMFPAKPSRHQQSESMGFALGVEYPKVVKAEKKRRGQRRFESVMRLVKR
jgi:hypothetical protein